MGVSNSSVYELERGENFFSPEMLARMSAAYGVPPAAFFPGFGSPAKPTPLEAWEILGEALEFGTRVRDPRVSRLLSAIETNPAILDDLEVVLGVSESLAEKDDGVPRRKSR